MNIELTKEQFKTLFKMVHLGEWMINGIRTSDEYIKEYEELNDFIFSFAKEAGLEKWVKFDETSGKFNPSLEFDENAEINNFIDESNNEIFWAELPDRLGRRDFVREYGEDAIKKMDRNERFLKHREFACRYEDEFCKNGINRLEIKEDE
ncbi:MAG: hypothetical protein ISS45_07135 [Candidatus Omnitrophica bacterium]|nr:hypothetical protein [Candidatus Omnitrophota bacterium]